MGHLAYVHDSQDRHNKSGRSVRHAPKLLMMHRLVRFVQTTLRSNGIGQASVFGYKAMSNALSANYRTL
jgi:hypothetical protein